MEDDTSGRSPINKSMARVRVKVNNREIEVPDHYTLLQAAEEAGFEIPRFCFHERLSVPGNCRMCLVEIKNGPKKPTASCSVRITDLHVRSQDEVIEFFTNTNMVKKSRESALEFLLINHPLDCPICDQGGECDLQDQVIAYGIDSSRYTEEKRAVADKYIGPLIKTVMTRCIHCTRCVRFMTEIAGVNELGLIGRGEDAEITTFLEQAMNSELQGNIIDLCPVGALTSRPYAFQARPWELVKTESIDVMDAVGSAIRIDTRGCEVMRILPRLNDAINEEWISDKTRFIWDGLRVQRLDKPYLRNKTTGRFIAVSWDKAFSAIKQAVSDSSKGSLGAIAGDLATVEEMYALKHLLASLGSYGIDCRQDGTILSPNLGRASYLFNPTISGIEESDALLIIGSNPRFEAAVLNARIRKRYMMGPYPIGLIGEREDLHYPYTHLGNNIYDLITILKEGCSFIDILRKSKKPIVLIGQGALIGENGKNTLALSAKFATKIGAISDYWNGFAILHTAASRVGGLDIGFIGDSRKTAIDIVRDSEVLFLLGADEMDLSEKQGFTVYIGSHGDRGAHAADVILPAAAYTEKTGLYVNTEGRVQLTNRANFSPGEARDDWAIIRAVSDVLGFRLPFDSLYALRHNLVRDYPHFAAINDILRGDSNDILKISEQHVASETILDNQSITSPIRDFYLTNPIARASAVMAECSSFFYNHGKKE